MKNISANMQALLASDGIASLACFYLLTRKDGTVMGFTDWPSNVSANGQLYFAADGYSRSAIQARADLAATNFNITGIVSSDAITDEDIRAGVYNNARIQIFLAVPTDQDFLTYGRVPLPGAYLGEVKIQDGVYTAEIRGWAYLFQQSYVEVYTPSCRADFCDSRCKLLAANYTITGHITAAAGAGSGSFVGLVDTAGSLAFAVGTNFQFGVLTFTSGLNQGYSIELQEITGLGGLGGDISANFYLPVPKNMNVGDTFTLLAGCNKTIAQCIVYGNQLNYRGEPFIPGMAFLFDYGEVVP